MLLTLNVLLEVCVFLIRDAQASVTDLGDGYPDLVSLDDGLCLLIGKWANPVAIKGDHQACSGDRK